MDHEGCLPEAYPDLSLSLPERNKIKEEALKQKRASERMKIESKRAMRVAARKEKYGS